MTEPFYKKSAGILATVLIGIIILSFMFTGFQTGMGPKTQDTIAQVNGTPIKASEYQRAYEQRLEMYRQMLGGTTLSSQQIAEFKIQDQVLEQLVEQKLVLNYSEKIGLFPASQEIA
jgi:peptidyl-prolyl cis-trans isomerase D